MGIYRFPWLFVGYAFTERLLDGYAPLFGIYAISFVVIVLACALVEVLRKRIFWVIPAALLVLGAWGASYIQFVQPKAAKPLSVSLIQGNIPQDLKWLTEYQVRTLEIYAGLTQSEWGRDLIVWPESSIPLFQTDIEPFLMQWMHKLKENHTAWVTGIPYWDVVKSHQVGSPLYYNSIMASGSDSSGLYKSSVSYLLVNIFRCQVAFLVLPAMQNDISMSGFTRGESDQKPLLIKGHALAAAICYEVALPESDTS